MWNPRAAWERAMTVQGSRKRTGQLPKAEDICASRHERCAGGRDPGRSPAGRHSMWVVEKYGAPCLSARAAPRSDAARTVTARAIHSEHALWGNARSRAPPFFNGSCTTLRSAQTVAVELGRPRDLSSNHKHQSLQPLPTCTGCIGRLHQGEGQKSTILGRLRR